VSRADYRAGFFSNTWAGESYIDRFEVLEVD